MARATERDRAGPDASGSFAGPHHHCWGRPIRCNSGRGFPIDVRDAPEIERAIPTFARGSNDGLIVASSPSAARHRDLIIKLAGAHRLPAVYSFRYYVTDGGLISYGPDPTDPFRRAAEYVDRILNGEKSADLPVQAPTKYELVINLKTAKALGLDVPPTLLARADEVIE